MTMIEIILLLVGCVFMIGSFFISEKLSSSELDKIAELSEDELKKIIEREVNNAGTQMDEVIEQKIEEAGEPESEIELTITEGRFHQVKRMFEAVGKKVLYLKRISMGPLQLTDDLKPGEYRPLTEEEITALKIVNK